jgi:DNA-binding LacI/PurR family transcriptional regulator
LTIAPEYIQETRFDRASGYHAALRLLKMVPRPTALFAANDLVALGALLAAKELGISCPHDVSIVGFDDSEFDIFTEPALTSVRQSGYQMGNTAARLLLERIENKRDQPRQIILPTELIIRNSVAQLNTTPNSRK